MVKFRRLSASTWILVLVRVIGLGLGFGVTALLSRLLGPDGFGNYALFLMLVTLLSVPLGQGWSTLMLRTVSRVADPERWTTAKLLLYRGRQLSVIYALAVLVCGWILAQLSSTEVTLSTLLGVAALLVVRQNAALRLALIRGAGYPVAAQFPELILQPAILMALLPIFAIMNMVTGWPVAAFALLVSSFVALLFGHWLQVILLQQNFSRAPDVGDTKMREWLIASGVIGLNGFLATLLSQVDSYVLAAFAGTSDVGIYRVAVQFSALGGFAYMALNYLAAARMNAAWSGGQLAEIERVSSRYGLVSLIFVIGVFLAIYIAGEPLIRQVFGVAFVPAVTPILILLGGQAINAAVGTPAILLTMTGHERLVIQVTAVALPINAVAALVLVPTFGVQGAAVANFVGVTYINLCYYWIARRRLGVNMAVWRKMF